ncbi:cAMP/cGMP-stimulated cAMP/cGMP phosphodiesterase [Cavenderia fasciculata]|uniref:3',5'-cyclic-GMP phosphodiesterase n=1 Tax=Cavenderia fasciculata TaxID=261658 RepID=F4PTB0_CACFS|nr:cAMP/cGMP-stimulated cAMP/cGMP phosphodiesterase [Cavenderia fasciculata]EGG20846.1 cAMP/cGMP-stimulated cAMP/cGMP phosphodiesterase [Cavenderia fasciculata]|eukprot:XP_004358696.1 cAMP/cGMP-stimulated cAMP/cGMP phosphodiesterase [Cavenderia fasciculata]
MKEKDSLEDTVIDKATTKSSSLPSSPRTSFQFIEELFYWDDTHVLDPHSSLSVQFDVELAKFIIALIVFRTKVIGIYSPSIIETVASMISSNVKFNNVVTDNNNNNSNNSNNSNNLNIKISIDEHLMVSSFANVEAITSINNPGLFSSVYGAIHIGSLLLQTLYNEYSSLKNWKSLVPSKFIEANTSTDKMVSPSIPSFNSVSVFQASHTRTYDLFPELNLFLKQCVARVEKDSILPAYYSHDTVRQKEEGAYLYNSSLGPIQIGVPPETIKTSLKKQEQVPQVYVLPHILSSHGVSYSEVEFPIFFNFFINKAATNPLRRVVMVGAAEQLERIRTIFKESMFGPDTIYINDEICDAKKASGYAIDFPAERQSLAFHREGKGETTIDDFLVFSPYDQQGKAEISLPSVADPSQNTSVTIVNKSGLVCFYEQGALKGLVDSTIQPSSTPHLNYGSPLFHHQTNNNNNNVELGNTEPHVVVTSSKFRPPTFGLSFLGTSHGFDPYGHTTGFIIWINGNGILVDPPIGTTTYLKSKGISHKLVDQVILTHCHSDHDSGILQKIVESEKITIFTTKTINESYKRKAKALTGIESISDYYNWAPVPIGEKIRIQGAEFEFDYSYHTIPTIRFKVSFCGKSIAYSSDTKYCPESLSDLVRKGVINERRESSLRMFVFDADVMIHECGVPPIHTSIEALNNLTESIKSRLLVVHTSRIPDRIEKVVNGQQVSIKVEGLRIPNVGLENTIAIPVGDYYEGYSRAVSRFKLMSNSFYFRHVPPSMLFKIFNAMSEVNVPAATTVIQAGESCDRCYLIESGCADVLLPSDKDILHKHHLHYFDSPTLDSVGGDLQQIKELEIKVEKQQQQQQQQQQQKGESHSSDEHQPNHEAVDQSNTRGDSKVIGQFIPGDTFGENALWKQQSRRAATVIASSDMKLLSITNDDFLRIQKEHRDEQVMDLLTNDLEKIKTYSPFLFFVLSKAFPFSQLQLTKEQIDYFAAAIDSEVVFQQGSVIIRENDNDNSLYIIRKGKVTLSKGDVEFKTLSKGECFGEISLLLGTTRSCTAKAAENHTHLLILKRDGFQSILDRYQHIKYNLTQLVEQRLGSLEQWKNS